jgi:hypothetical protein
MEDFDQSTFDWAMELTPRELVEETYKAGLLGNEKKLKYLRMAGDSFTQVIDNVNNIIQEQVDAAKALAKEADKAHKATNKRQRQNRKAGRR